MPHRETAPAGHPCWIDLFSSDPDASQAFYGGLFGWTSESAGEDYGGYINFAKAGEPVAGCMKNNGESPVDVWSVYLATDDLDATAALVADNGGQVSVPPMDVMELGRMAVVSDSGQAMVGVWQPGLHKGFTVLAEPDAPAWFELFTRDYDASVDFYRKVFGWDAHSMGDTPEFRYSTLCEGPEAAAGIMDATAFLPEGVPAHWSVYFGSVDADATVAKAVELGATVAQAAEDTPYGRMATLVDPTGATFKVVQPPAEA